MFDGADVDSLYKTGDPYQKTLRKQYKKQKYQGHYHLHFSFTEQEWTDLLAYLKSP